MLDLLPSISHCVQSMITEQLYNLTLAVQKNGSDQMLNGHNITHYIL